MIHFLRRVLILCVLVVTIVVGIALQQPSQSTKSAVVFSNLPTNNGNSTNNFIVVNQDGGVGFDVPVGQDYRVNSIQASLRNANPANQVITAHIHSDNSGLPGSVVVTLDSQIVPTGGISIIATFTPIGSSTLTNGQRYWLILSNAAPDVVNWMSNAPPITPIGVFTFVDNGLFSPGTFFQAVSRYSVSIDADPISAPGGGTVISACNNSDGRLNPVCAEPWQTAAIYCLANGTIEVYGITDSVGWLAFRTTQSEIDAIGIPAQNSLIERSSDGKIRLYRLSTGEFQVNSPIFDRIRGNLPDGYVFIFDGCS